QLNHRKGIAIIFILSKLGFKETTKLLSHASYLFLLDSGYFWPEIGNFDPFHNNTFKVFINEIHNSGVLPNCLDQIGPEIIDRFTCQECGKDRFMLTLF